MGAGNVPAAAPLSLNPYMTRYALFRYGACAMLFVLLASLLRTRRAITWAASFLLAAGLFQVVYAIIDQTAGSGGTYVFGARKVHYLSSFSGTFFNKNHFAGFLEMLLPLAAALVLAVRRTRQAARLERLSDRVVETLSEPATHKRLLLSTIPVLLCVGIALSVSRSAVICSVVALCALAVLAILNRGRRAFITLASVLIGAGAVLIFFVSGPMISGFERELTGRMPSTTVRLDMLRSAWYLVSDFPLLGTGLGTTQYVFGRYQSLNLGNIHVDYLANDWAQIACEAGIIGLVTVAAGLCFFFVSSLLAAMRRTGRFCKWVAIGALMGMLAMMLHSFTDFNLTRTTSNGILFAALLALAHAAARAGEAGNDEAGPRAHWKLALGPAPLRAVFALLLIVPAGALAAVAGKVAVADVRFNYYRHYAEKPTGIYFFLGLPERPANARAVARFDLDEAAQLVPGNPVYVHELGQADMDEIERRLADVREAIACSLHPGIAAEKERDPEGFKNLSLQFERAAEEKLADEIKQSGLLGRAEENFRKAIRLAPTVGQYHFALAQALLLKTRLALDATEAEREALTGQMDAELERTVYFGYNVPYLLFNAATVFLQETADLSGARREQRIKRASALLTRAVYAARDELATKAYELLRTAGIDNRGIIEAAPETVWANLCLYRFFYARKEWPEAVIALNRIEAAAEEGPAGEPDTKDGGADTGTAVSDEHPDAPKEMPPMFTWGTGNYASVEFRLEIARRRAAVLGYLGKWPARQAAVAKRADLARRQVEPLLAEAETMRVKGHYEAALRGYGEVLEKTPHNVDALIGMARITSIPHYRDLVSDAYAPAACLFRAVINNDSLSPEQSGELLAALDNRNSDAPGDEPVEAFVRSVAIMLQSGVADTVGSPASAMLRLEKLAAELARGERAWRQQHLTWYYLGRGHESRGDDELAREMYSKAVGVTPTHRRSLAALLRLAKKKGDAQAAEEHAARLARITPMHPCTVTFSGRIRLLGYSITPADAEKGAPPAIRYYWEFLEPLPGGYHARTYFLEHQWRIFCEDRRVIAPAVGPYPAELARCGEVVVETRPLPRKLPNVKYVAFGICSQKPPKGYANWLEQDGGGPLARAAFFAPAPR
ncbi:MAG: O-antigen ligase family protein [Planctomycetota bacterium]